MSVDLQENKKEFEIISNSFFIKNIFLKVNQFKLHFFYDYQT